MPSFDPGSSQDRATQIRALLGGEQETPGFSKSPFANPYSNPYGEALRRGGAEEMPMARAPQLDFTPPAEIPQDRGIGDVMANLKKALNPEKPTSDYDGMIMNLDKLKAELAALRGTPDVLDEDSGQGDFSGQASFRPRPRVSGDVGTGEIEDDSPMAQYLRITRQVESGGNDAAVNPNGGANAARGRYQFLPATWRGLGMDPGKMLDPGAQEEAMRRYTQQSVDTLKASGLPVTPATLYMLHFQGHGAGPAILKNPGARLGSLLPDVVFKHNPNISRNMTGEQLLAMLERKFQ